MILTITRSNMSMISKPIAVTFEIFYLYPVSHNFPLVRAASIL